MQKVGRRSLFLSPIKDMEAAVQLFFYYLHIMHIVRDIRTGKSGCVVFIKHKEGA
jgi:hypothetical protein